MWSTRASGYVSSLHTHIHSLMRYQVYGTSNLRVVDLSILPVITAVHTQATTYALAEQGAHYRSLSFIWDVLLTPGCSLCCYVAADIIKADHGI